MVIAIISILASILFPAFSGAREKARQAVCLSNLKQLYLAFSMYLQDYDEFFPCNGDPFLWMGRNWRPLIAPYVRGTKIESNPYRYQAPIQTEHSDVFLCPSDIVAPVAWERTSYGYSLAFYHSKWQVNSMKEWKDALRSDIPPIPQNLSSVLYPDKKALLGEWLSNHEKIRNDKGWWCHEGARNFLFVDGHCKFLRASQLRIANDGYPDINLTIDGIEGKDIE